MKKLNVGMTYMAYGVTSIEVPDDFTLEQAIQYAINNIRDIPIPKNAEYVCESELIDEENCEFEEKNENKNGSIGGEMVRKMVEATERYENY